MPLSLSEWVVGKSSGSGLRQIWVPVLPLLSYYLCDLEQVA